VAVRLIEMQFKLVEGRHSLSPLAMHLLWATKMGAKMGLRLRGLISLLAATTLFAGVLANGVADAPAAVQSQANALTEKNVETIALQWFEQMLTGQIDRTQLTAEYSAQLTDDAVKKMAAYLNEYRYGSRAFGTNGSVFLVPPVRPSPSFTTVTIIPPLCRTAGTPPPADFRP
jgi:hypothetical protein